jgi:hypothetical protein
VGCGKGLVRQCLADMKAEQDEAVVEQINQQVGCFVIPIEVSCIVPYAEPHQCTCCSRSCIKMGKILNLSLPVISQRIRVRAGAASFLLAGAALKFYGSATLVSCEFQML